MNIEKALGASLRKILRPLVKILIRNGISLGSFYEIAKRVYVDVAFDADFSEPGKKQTISRVSVLTGLNRKEVGRVRDTDPDDDSDTSQKHNRATRVIGGWVSDLRYITAKGKPRILPFKSGKPSFSSLVKDHSGDITPKTMLDILLAGGSVEKTEDNLIRLIRPAFVPSGDPTDKVSIMGTDVSELIETIDHNLKADEDDRRFQRKVVNFSVRPGAVQEFRYLTKFKAQSLLEELNEWLQRHVTAAEQNAVGDKGKHVSVGVYYYENDSEV